MNIIRELQDKDLIQDISSNDLDEKLQVGDKFYAGFDPTAPSLHLGNFCLIMTMLRLAQAGLKPIMLFGGATGQVGDPMGKSEERPMLNLSEIENNVQTQKEQASAIFDRLGFDIEFTDNAEWTSNITLTSFLRDVGKYITVNYMTAKETVKRRLEGDGISYTEFSYMLLQANDFLYLFQNRDCKMQIGGSDQWGNLTCGLELIRKKISEEAHAFSIPLLTKSDGKKFGKSEDGALWLDPKETSPYQLHQFLFNSADADVIKLIQTLTFADSSKIKELEKSKNDAPHERKAQKYLADELCELIHGREALAEVKTAAEILFGGDPTKTPVNTLKSIFSEVPSISISNDHFSSSSLIELLVESGACPSKGQARKMAENGGIYVNNQRITDASEKINSEQLIENKLLLLRSGKKSYYLVEVS